MNWQFLRSAPPAVAHSQQGEMPEPQRGCRGELVRVGFGMLPPRGTMWKLTGGRAEVTPWD